MRTKISAEYHLNAEAAPPYRWAKHYALDERAGSTRLKIAVAESGIDLILRLFSDDAGPFQVLYVLAVARGGEPGRYQLDGALTYDWLESYLNDYRPYFEGDGRHDIWIKGSDTNLIVYDRHELLYAYGDTAAYETKLREIGYEKGEVSLNFPHTHFYHQEFDHIETQILESGAYTRFDLVPGADFDPNDP